MSAPIDYKKFQAKLNAYSIGQSYTEAEAAEAFHNLVGLVRLFRSVEREICEMAGKNWTVFGGWLRESFAPKMAGSQGVRNDEYPKEA